MKIVSNNCDIKLIELQKKLMHTMNKIPTLEQNSIEIPSSDITIMLNLVEHGMNGDKPEGYLRKLKSLKCSYGLVTLYLLYHLINMQYRESYKEMFVHIYSECMHHMLQVMYLADGPVFQEMWFLAITLDGIKRNELVWSDINFIGMANSLMGFLTNICLADQFSSKFPVFGELIGWFDFISHNNELLSKLMLSDGHQSFMADFYSGDDRFEIYQFFWNDDRDYTKFAPPAEWFSSYKPKRLQKVYKDVALKWKFDFYSLTSYTDIIRNLVFAVTYHALLRHCYYLLVTWYIVFERVKALSSPCERKVMQNYCMKLMQIPLFSVERIFRSMHDLEEMKHLNNIKSNLTNHENPNQEIFNTFVSNLLKRYNFYAIQFDFKRMDHDSMKMEFSVPKLVNLSIVKTALLKFAEVLDNYYQTVKCTLSPTRFRVIEYFKSAKTVCDIIETPQDPNMAKSMTITRISNPNVFNQDLEVYKQFLRTLNLIPTMSQLRVRIPHSELDAMMDHADKELQTTKSYLIKVEELKCMYAEAALYMYYHIHNLFINDIMTENFFYVVRYCKCIHRIISILYLSKILMLRSIWVVAITLDAIRHGQMKGNEAPLKKAIASIVGPLKVCYKNGYLIKPFKTYDELVKKGPYDFVTNNDKLLSKIMISDGHERFMMDLYRNEEQFDVYQFLWNDNRGYTNFAPPADWFPTYTDKHLSAVYNDVAKNWKKTYHILLLYKDSIKNLGLIVTYYALILHSYYLQMNWHIVFRQVQSGGPYVQDDHTTLMQIPLALVENIFWYMQVSSEDMECLNDIKCNLTNYENSNQRAFNDFVNRLLDRYNFYGRKLDVERMHYSKIKDRISIPDRMKFSTLKTTLLGFAAILDNYYETVKRALLPTTIRAIEYFTSSKPARIGFKTIKVKNNKQKTIVISTRNKERKPYEYTYPI